MATIYRTGNLGWVMGVGAAVALGTWACGGTVSPVDGSVSSEPSAGAACGVGHGCAEASGAKAGTSSPSSEEAGGAAGSSVASRPSNGGMVGAQAGTTSAESGGATSGVTPAPAAAKQYAGKGFVVHEWGTDTIVVGSDGSLQRGLHHEEEDLPPFVYDRVKSAAALGATPSVTIKMETPVTYFYSEKPLSAEVSVSFPRGVMTQWYPQVIGFSPAIAAAGSIELQMPAVPASVADPALDLDFPFRTDYCREKYSTLHDGRLDWGKVEVLPRDALPPGVPDAPLDRFTFGYARQVAANALRAGTGEGERFLFYRGLGEFDLPVTVQAGADRALSLSNAYSEPMGRVFLLNVDAERGAFSEHAEGIAAGGHLDDRAPSLEGAETLSDYAERLGDRVTDALDDSGLFHDEAQAMVNTWKRQWFRTPGIRLLYLIPQTWTDQSIPLNVTPAPDQKLRVMLIRVEVITPEQEASDVSALQATDASVASIQAHFSALGRFAEPRLRRALTLSPNSLGDTYLAQIQGQRASLVSRQ